MLCHQIKIFTFQATGLKGLAVAANPHHTLTALYGKIMRAVAKMPETAAYRKHTETVIGERAKIVASVILRIYYSQISIEKIKI